MRGTRLQDYEAELTAYAVEITKWLVSRGVNRADAQDVVQDVFVKMLEMDLLVPPSKLRAWMYRVALRSYIDTYRREQKYQKILAELLNELPKFQEEPPDLRPFIKKLKPLDRTLLQYFYFENQSIKQIAARTGASENKVKVTLFRARKRLKKILQKEGITEWTT